ncbi:hypothetical protein HYQ46_004612 [Verticillium longisporum]|nr:hypothetical protein HYQ46_004612 [Verticillium longisporum]
MSNLNDQLAEKTVSSRRWSSMLYLYPVVCWPPHYVATLLSASRRKRRTPEPPTARDPPFKYITYMLLLVAASIM